MKNKQDLSRRDFIRNSVMAGGAVLLSGVLPSHAQTPIFSAAENSDSPEADELLRGVSDIHLHAAPDSKARLGNELEFARAARDAGYKSMLFKSNDFSCHDRAYLIRQELQGFEVFGSLCMNRVHGDKVNVFAAEKAVTTTGNLCRCIWMPTQDAVYQNIRYVHGGGFGVTGGVFHLMVAQHSHNQRQGHVPAVQQHTAQAGVVKAYQLAFHEL